MVEEGEGRKKRGDGKEERMNVKGEMETWKNRKIENKKKAKEREMGKGRIWRRQKEESKGDRK